MLNEVMNGITVALPFVVGVGGVEVYWHLDMLKHLLIQH